jgi:hypothetical protein
MVTKGQLCVPSGMQSNAATACSRVLSASLEQKPGVAASSIRGPVWVIDGQGPMQSAQVATPRYESRSASRDFGQQPLPPRR